jgi:hypothetical protein
MRTGLGAGPTEVGASGRGNFTRDGDWRRVGSPGVWQGVFRPSRLVEVYDAGFTWSREEDFFLSVVHETRLCVVALACGTGRLTLGLASAGHR